MVATFIFKVIRKIVVGYCLGMLYPFLFLVVFALYDYVSVFLGNAPMEYYGLGFIAAYLGALIMGVGIIGSLILEYIWELRNIQMRFSYEIAHILLFMLSVIYFFFDIRFLLAAAVAAIVWLALDRLIRWGEYKLRGIEQ